MINRNRAIEYFSSIAKIHSPSRQEGRLARRLAKDFKNLQCRAYVDNAGKRLDGNTGNLILKFSGYGTGRRKQAVLLAAHMDTVEPSKGIQPVKKSAARLESKGKTILAADDKAGIALIHEILQTIRETQCPCAPLDIVFTVCEEEGLLGSANLDATLISARRGFVLDSDSGLSIHFRAPGVERFRVHIRGRSAHSGTSPEKGINAIAIGAEAIAAFRWGRFDSWTTTNIARVQGGGAINQVPASFHMDIEIRSRKLNIIHRVRKEFLDCVRGVAEQYKLKDDTCAECSLEEMQSYKPLSVPQKDEFFRSFLAFAKEKGVLLKRQHYGGGFDGNRFSQYGIQTANICTGARDIHSTREWLDLNEFQVVGDLMAGFLLEYSSPGGRKKQKRKRKR